MKLRLTLTVSAVLLCCPSGLLAAEAAKPNILFILVDDLGYGDIGVFYQNQRREAGDRSEPWHVTPNLDAMAGQGIQLRGHYCSAPVCAPSRASLLLGVHQGHANVRDNQFDKALEDNHTIASVVKAAGYATSAIGKWGLQGGPGGKGPDANPKNWAGYPTKRGFDSYYGYIRHGDGHAHYPKEDGKQVWDNDKEVSSGLDMCYTSDLFTARAKKWIIDHRKAHPDQPFLMYLAYDTPHAKTQFPPSAYPKGGGLDGGLQWVGKPGHMINTSSGKYDSFCHPDYVHATWDHDKDPKTPEKPWPDVYKRYATVVRRIDNCVGDLLQLLKDLKIDKNTLVVFTSDNGVSQESYLKEDFNPEFFRSFGPFDGIKRDCWEGGVRVGAIARYPGVIPEGQVSNEPTTHYDWLATFAELSGVPIPARADGVSLVPELRGEPWERPEPVYIEYFHNGKTPDYATFLKSHRKRQRKQMQTIRFGDLLGVRYNISNPDQPFEIYNVAKDPQEKTDLGGSSDKYASFQQRLQQTVAQVRRPNDSAKRPYDKQLLSAVKVGQTEPGVAWEAFEMASPWTPRLDGRKPDTSGATARPDVSVSPRGENVALLFQGYLEVPRDGEYQLHLTADSGALLRVHDATVIDADFGHKGGQEVSGSVLLKAGKHPFRLYYARQAGGKPQISLKWSRPSGKKQEVPASAFSHGRQD